MFSADHISGSRDFTQDLTSGVLILIHSPDACVLVIACVECARVQLKTLSSLLKVARNSFQHLYFDGSLQPLFNTCCYNHGIKKLSNHW